MKFSGSIVDRLQMNSSGVSPSQCLETAEVTYGNEALEMGSELVMVVIVEALDGRVLDGAVHALDLAVGPWMLGLCQPVFDIVGLASAIERMTAPHSCWFCAVFWQIGKLDAVVGQNDLNLVGNGGHQGIEECTCRRSGGLFNELDESEHRSAADANVQI